MADQTRIFDGNHLRGTLFHGDGTGKTLIVKFESRDLQRTGFKETAPVNHFAKQGHPVLALQSAANDWFINSETTRFETALAQVAADYPSPRLIGFSMGGYAALAFAGKCVARKFI